ncbi:MAG: hypothetical protein CVV33_00290 [Methanomicrobiales archaeon HGW-Methanomicrobiales-4]|nr:MAG: hypothetical protein CVV33_00290 [Methanomicrobiales archaeon HGW-Methanomicrobiales-4]
MKKTIRTTTGDWLEINPETDTWIIRTSRPTTRIGADYAKGEDLYLMNDAKGIRHYYIVSWVSQNRDYKESFKTCNEEEKDQFIRDRVLKAGKIGLDADITDRIEKYFPGLLKAKK